VEDLRPTATARDTIRLLAAHPVIAAEVVAGRLDVSARTARTALEELHGRGIVAPYEPPRRGRGRPTHLWVATRLLDAIAIWGSAQPIL